MTTLPMTTLPVRIVSNNVATPAAPASDRAPQAVPWRGRPPGQPRAIIARLRWGLARVWVGSMLAAVMVPVCLHAQSNLVLNASFEHGLTNWQVTAGSTVAFLPYGTVPGTPDGYYSMRIRGGVFQDVSTVPGRDYLVQFDCVPPLPRVRWAGTEVEGLFIGAVPGLSSWQRVWFTASAESELTRLSLDSSTTLVTNADDSVSSVAENLRLDNVRVGWAEEPAAIQGQPGSVTVYEGATVTFSVTASGGPPLSYEWRFNGVAIPGATSRDFQIGVVQSTQAGAYSGACLQGASFRVWP